MSKDTPMSTIPLRVGSETFQVASKMSARKTAQMTSMEPGLSSIEYVNFYIRTMAEQITTEPERERFSALWDDPEYGQGVLLELWEQMVEHYAHRPTDEPSRYSSGFGILNGGSTSTPASSSPEAKDSTASPTTSGAS